MIPLYILGLLKRFGPLHGYQIKKIIVEQLADFTQIKLPTIYYHLKKMEEAGLLSACAPSGDRPERIVYTFTDKGLEAFGKMLSELVRFEYRPTFPSDGAFYFSDHFQRAELAEHLQTYAGRLKRALAAIEKHRSETLPFVPEDERASVSIIFRHHALHYRAELQWAEESLRDLTE